MLGCGPQLTPVTVKYWQNPGAFNQMGLEPTKPDLDRFLAIMSSIVQAAFGFSGIEIVSLSCGNITDHLPLLSIFLGRRVSVFRCPPTGQTSVTDSAGPL